MKYIITSFAVFLFVYSFAQTYNLNSSTNGQTYVTCGATLYDSGGPSGNYSNNENFEITFQTSGNGCIRAVIEEYDIEEAYDFLYFYDGTSSASPQINSRVTGYPFVNGSNRNETGNAYYAQSGYITIRFYTDGATVRGGFKLKIDCPDNCMAPSCTGTTPAGEYCNTSTPICDFNGYCGNTSTSYPTDHEEIEDTTYGGSGIFCGGINNNSWLSFVADSTTAILDVWVSNCQGINNGTGPVYGVQMQVYETDCSYNNFTPVSNCWSPAKMVDGQIIATGLTVGNTYLLMVDGFAQDNCEYTFSASSGLIIADAGHDETICEGESVSLTATGGPNVIWSANPPDPSLTGQETNMTITVSPSETTTYTATVSGANPNCPGTADVVVFVDAADASFTGLDSYYCEDATPVTLTGNYPSGIFAGSGISGNTFDPGSLSPGNYNISYSYNYSVVTAFEDDFDPWPDPGWVHGANTGSSSWAHGKPNGGNGQNNNIYSNPDPVTDHSSNTDNKVWGQGLSDTDGDGLGGYYDSSDEWLKSPAIDCSGLSNTVLSFWRYANFEPNWDEAYVQISTDGVSFTNLPSEPLYPQDDGWVHRIINISSYADGQPTVYIRFRSISDNLQTYSGWNIDDFSITGVQSGGTCVSTDIQTTTINALPVVNAGSDQSICAGQTATLNGSITGGASTGIWTTSGSGSFNNSSLLNATYTPSSLDIAAGIVTLTLTSDDPAGPCGQVSDNLTLTIIPSDDAGFSYASGTYCSTGTDPTPSINTPGGTFSFSPAGLVINTSTGTVDLDASTPQTYTITYTTNGACPNSSSVSFTITNGFDAEFSYSGPYCEGDTNPLPNHTTGSDGVYSATPAGLNFVNNSTGEIDLSGSSPGVYTVTNTIPASGGCSAATYSQTVQIDQAPQCSAGSDAVICEGDTYIPNGTMGGSALNVSWTTSGDGTFLYGNTTTPTYTPGQNDIVNGSVVLTIMTNDPSGPCTAASDNMTLTINQAANVFAGNDTVICENEILNLSSATLSGSATSVTWTTSGDGSFDNSSAIQPVYTPGAADISNGSVFLTVTTNDPDNTGPCVPVSDQIQVSINTAPVVYAGQDTSICSYGSYQISGASMSGTSSIQWSTSGDGSFSNTAILNPVYTPGTNDISNGNIYLYLTSEDPAGPCDAAVDSMLLKINYPPVLEISLDSSNCNQANGSIAVTPIGGVEPYQYLWNTSATDSLITGLTSGNYSVTVTDALGCSSDTMVHLYDIGAGTIIFTSTQDVLCYGDSTGSIYTNISGGTPPFSYTWSNGSTDVALDSLPAGTYSLTVTDANNCIISDSTQINQPQAPLAIVDSIKSISCYGAADGYINISVSGGTPPYTQLWSPSIVLPAENLDTGTYILTVTDANNCEKKSSYEITEPAEIKSEFTITPPFCESSNDGVVTFTTIGGVGQYLYSWSDSIMHNDSVRTGLQTGDYTVTVYDNNGCNAVYAISLNPQEDQCLLIPTLITPNQDGHNDTWIIKGIEYYYDINIEIYNRWGDKIYNFSGTGSEYLNNPWKAEYNGKPLPVGSYVYVVDLKNNTEPYNGVVSVKR